MRLNAYLVWVTAIVLIGMTIHVSRGQSPRLKRNPNMLVPQWEYQVVAFGVANADAHTQVFNKMAIDGWEYVGLVHPGTPHQQASSVAFRRMRDQFPAEYRR